MTCPHTDPSCWCSPLPMWPSDADRWAAFCLAINSRIAHTRRAEGRDDIGTFSPPIPANVALRELPAGRVMPVPANNDRRDDHGRFLPKAQADDMTWLLDPNGPNDPAWRARIRAAMATPETARTA